MIQAFKHTVQIAKFFKTKILIFFLILLFIATILEMFSISLIVPLITSTITEENLFKNIPFLGNLISQLSDFDFDIRIYLVSFFFIFFLFRTIFLVITIKLQTLYYAQMRSSISVYLYKKYL